MESLSYLFLLGAVAALLAPFAALFARAYRPRKGAAQPLAGPLSSLVPFNVAALVMIGASDGRLLGEMLVAWGPWPEVLLLLAPLVGCVAAWRRAGQGYPFPLVATLLLIVAGFSLAACFWAVRFEAGIPDVHLFS